MLHIPVFIWLMPLILCIFYKMPIDIRSARKPADFLRNDPVFFCVIPHTKAIIPHCPNKNLRMRCSICCSSLFQIGVLPPSPRQAGSAGSHADKSPHTRISRLQGALQWRLLREPVRRSDGQPPQPFGTRILRGVADDSGKRFGFGKHSSLHTHCPDAYLNDTN